MIYDDWRHLYFIYPPFVLMALYAINKLYTSRYRKIVMALCGIQVVSVAIFMMSSFPLNQVYFNSLVSHKKNYLRTHFEMDYWGSSDFDALKYLLKTQNTGVIKVTTDLIDQWSYDSNYVNPLTNNLAMLNIDDRKRIKITIPSEATYFVTIFRGHPDNFYPDANVVHSFNVLNSPVNSIYRIR